MHSTSLLRCSVYMTGHNSRRQFTILDRKVSRIILLVVVIAAMGLLAACGGDEPEPTPVPVPAAMPTPIPTPSPPTPIPLPTATPVIPTPMARTSSVSVSLNIDPNDLLQRSSEAMSKVGTFHFDVSGLFKISTGQTDVEVPLSYVGDVQVPDKTHGRISLSVIVFVLEMEIITVGDVTYTTNPQSGAWEISEGGAMGIPNPADFAQGGEPPLADAQYAGDEERDGHQVYRLTGLAQFGTLDSAGQQSKATIWIGTDDLLLREISLQAEISLDALGLPVGDLGLEGSGTVELSIKLSDFGKPVSIEAPIIP